MNLVLIGIRGAGKTSVGLRLAKELDLGFVDLDREIEAQAGCSIASVFEHRKEAGFRSLEAITLENLFLRTPSIVATGGGVVLLPENRLRLQQLGVVVWLDCHPDVACLRIEHQERSSTIHLRPSLTTLPRLEEMRHIHNQRDLWYRQTAQHVLDTTHLSVEEICLELKHLWQML